jgi:uncharacterized membrane protein (DUF2068 family)
VASTRSRERAPTDGWLVWIAGFKVVKATLLLAAGIAGLGLLDAATAHRLTGRAMELAADHHFRVLGALIGTLLDLDPRTLRLVSLGSVLYSALFFCEGIGLLLGQLWAEYLTIASTGGLIPFEMVEFHRHVTPVRIAVLIANLAIVAYLGRRVTARVESWSAGRRAAREA